MPSKQPADLNLLAPHQPAEGVCTKGTAGTVAVNTGSTTIRFLVTTGTLSAASAAAEVASAEVPAYLSVASCFCFLEPLPFLAVTVTMADSAEGLAAA